MNKRIIQTVDLCRLLGLSRSTIWRMERDGLLPPRVDMGIRKVGWLSTDIEQFIENGKLKAIEGKETRQ